MLKIGDEPLQVTVPFGPRTMPGIHIDVSGEACAHKLAAQPSAMLAAASAVTYGSFSLATSTDGKDNLPGGTGMKLASAGKRPGAVPRSGGATNIAPRTRSLLEDLEVAHHATARHPKLCATNTTSPEKERNDLSTAATQSARSTLRQSFSATR